MEISQKQNLCVHAYHAGKIHDADKYATEVLEELFTLKRIASIAKFLALIKTLGYSTKKISKYESSLQHLRGYAGAEINQLEWHIEHFKSQQSFLKQYLLNESYWEKLQYSLCYEYILQFGFDREIFEKLSSFQTKTIEKVQQQNIILQTDKKYNCNYDQIAYDLISGEKRDTEFEQKNIIADLKHFDFEQRTSEAKEMPTAFRFLGMDEVVIYLCDRLIPIQVEAKERVSLIFLSVESLINLGRIKKAIDVIHNCLKMEPLLEEEKIAFIYLQAEVYLLEGNTGQAKKYFQQIYNINPHYRLVNQRLKTIEAN